MTLFPARILLNFQPIFHCWPLKIMSMKRKHRNLEKDASILSTLICVLFYLAAFAYIIIGPGFMQTPLASNENLPISIELLEISNLAPVPEEIPEPEAEPQAETEPKLETEVEPLPEPEAIPEPKPKPKPKPKAQKPKRQETPKQNKDITAQTAPAAPKAASSPKGKASFISAFTKEVQRCKYYPKSARQAQITGTVKVRVTFDAQGRISGASLVANNYHPSLAEGAMTTINKVKSRWGPKEGGPASLVVPINYEIR